MIRINEIKLPLEGTPEDLLAAAAKALRIPKRRITSLDVAKKSLDSRKKDNLLFVFSVDVTVDGDDAEILEKSKCKKAQLTEPFYYSIPENKRKSNLRPIVAGFGPGGIWAALTLARAGLRPIVLERGRDVDSRTADVNRFWQTKVIDETSNVQFGEGGAGTFSDGKLTTGIKDKLCRKVFLDFVEFGAPEEILYSWRPHIGTDKLGQVVKNMREEIKRLGGDVLFSCRLTDIIIANGVVHGVTYINEKGETIDLETDSVILAVGHSAKDTVEMLYNKGIDLMQKPFSVGARIEHPRTMIDRAQYGDFAGHPALGAADYKLACHPPHGRGAYTFCMCPGGTVVAAASENGGVVVNGMSDFARNKENSNCALLVGVEPEDFGSEHPLAGFKLQREIEEKAFRCGGGDFTAPAQLVGDFLQDVKSTQLGSVNPSCPTGVKMGDIREVLPKKVTDTMADAIVKMGTQLKGFDLPDAVLTAPETRSSSPVRVLRDEFYQALKVRGLYPCGEGAGYAGGIVSAAVDGIRCAHAVLSDEF
ncbi:MAG: FAD-dependent oxidoreductase [Clostridia bacterium]|nr:FAD-dependent oxidoreductase [Clostridia bacterium]